MKSTFKTVAMGVALCAIFGCKGEKVEKAEEVKALGIQVASQEVPQAEFQVVQTRCVEPCGIFTTFCNLCEFLHQFFIETEYGNTMNVVASDNQTINKVQ